MAQITDNNSRKILHQLHNLTKAIDSAGDQILRSEMGLGFSQFKILTFLQDQAQQTQTSIATTLNLTPPAVSRHVEVLRGKGMVVIRVNPKNKREHLISLTSVGRVSLQEIWNIFDTSFNDITTVLSADEQEQLVGLLTRLFTQVPARK